MIDWNNTQLWTNLGIVVSSVILWHLLAQRKQQQWPVAPGWLPFFGHVLSMANSDDFFSVLNHWTGKVGKDGIYEFSLFGTRWIVLCSAETVMEAMSLRPFKLIRGRMESNSISSLNVGGVYDAEGHMWKEERRIVAPALNRNHIQDYFLTIKRVAKRLTQKWENKREVVANADMPKCALDVIALSILGMDFNTLNDPDFPLAKSIQNLFHAVFVRALSPVQYWKIPFIGQYLDGGIRYSKQVTQPLTDIVRRHRDGKANITPQEEQQAEKKTFLEKALDLSSGETSKLDEDRMVGNLIQLIMAGTDTSSNAISSCLWEVAQDSGLQDELYKEMLSLEKELDDLTMEDVLECFPRLRSLFFETLRVKGPAAYLFLEPTETLNFHGKTISPGTVICSLLRSPGKKANAEVPCGPKKEGPDQYCPRRWLVPLEKNKPDGPMTVIQPSNKSGGFMAFGHGPRACPGKQFGEVEVLTMLIFIIRTFEIAVAKDHPPLKYVSRFVETFDGDMRLSLKRRVQS